MPNGFPAFRHDPTTAPRYIIKTAKTSPDTASTSTGSTQQSTETSKLQQPTEQGVWLLWPMTTVKRNMTDNGIDPPKKTQSKLKGKFEKLFGWVGIRHLQWLVEIFGTTITSASRLYRHHRLQNQEQTLFQKQLDDNLRSTTKFISNFNCLDDRCALT